MVLYPNKYCVYYHLDADGKVFYVGSGVPSRPFVMFNRSASWKAAVSSMPKYTVKVIRWFDSPYDARDLEAIEIERLQPRINKAAERTPEMNAAPIVSKVELFPIECTNANCRNTWVPRVRNPVACPKCRQYLKTNNNKHVEQTK